MILDYPSARSSPRPGLSPGRTLRQCCRVRHQSGYQPTPGSAIVVDDDGQTLNGRLKLRGGRVRKSRSRSRGPCRSSCAHAGSASQRSTAAMSSSRLCPSLSSAWGGRPRRTMRTSCGFHVRPVPLSPSSCRRRSSVSFHRFSHERVRPTMEDDVHLYRPGRQGCGSGECVAALLRVGNGFGGRRRADVVNGRRRPRAAASFVRHPCTRCWRAAWHRWTLVKGRPPSVRVAGQWQQVVVEVALVQ